MTEEHETIIEWIHNKGIVNEKGEPISFANHLFLFEPYLDFSKEQVYKKCSQVGVSVMMNLKVFYMMAKYGLNIIYTLPADNDVWEFVPSKTDKIIMANPAIQELIQDVNKTQMKQINNRFVYFKGTRSKTAPIMTTADLLIHDEEDRSDLKIIGDYESRIKRSKFKGKWELSNPWLSNSGVDVSWNRSDKKEWFIKCPNEKCGEEFVIEWPRNIDYKRKEYICHVCQKVIDDNTRRLGKWKKTAGGRVSGYHISQMMAPWISCAELIKEEEEKDPEYFDNFVLGEPTISGVAQDFRKIIIDAVTIKDLRKPPYYLGIDVGKIKHYVLGNDDGVFEIGKLETREQVEDLIERWDPYVVMDAGPERTWAEEFREKYVKFWICFFHKDKDRKIMITWGEEDKEGFVYADRNRVIDNVVDSMFGGELLFDLRPADIESYIKHWNVMVRKEELNALNQKRYFWDVNKPNAANHYAFATVYYYIARSRGGKSKAFGAPVKQPTVVLPTISTTGISLEDIERAEGEQKDQELRKLME